MKEIYKFLFLPFGVLVGLVISLPMVILYIYRYGKRQLNGNKSDGCDVEECMVEKCNRPTKRRIFQNDKDLGLSSFNNIDVESRSFKKKNIKNDDVMVHPYKQLSTKGGGYLDGNNNTYISKIGNTEEGIFEISSISSNESQNTPENTNKSMLDKNRIQKRVFKRFSPMCTSSPLPKDIIKSSSNGTFSISEPIIPINSKEINDVHNNSFNRKTVYKCHSERIISDLKLANCNNSISGEQLEDAWESKRSKNMNENLILNHIEENVDKSIVKRESHLFDPKYEYDELPDGFSRQFVERQNINLIPFCCQRNNLSSNKFRIHHKIICETFGKAGNMAYEYMIPQYSGEITFNEMKAISNLDLNTFNLTNSSYNIILWLPGKKFEVGKVAYFEDRKVTFLTKNVSSTTCRIMATKMMTKDSKTKVKIEEKYFTKRNILNTVHNKSNLYSSPHSQSSTFFSDTTWKGRSRPCLNK